MAIKVLSFDMACTLFYEPGCSKSWYEVTLKNALNNVYDYLTSKGYTVDYDLLYRYYKKISKIRQKSRREIWHLFRMHIAFSRMRLNLDSITMYRVYKVFVEAIANSFTISQDHKMLLKELKSRGYKIVLSTDTGSHEIPLMVLEKTGTVEYFDYVVSSHLVGYTKLSPKFYKYVAKLVNVEPNEILHVGDSFERDYLVPSKIGIRTVLSSSKCSRKDINCITRLDDIIEYIS